MLEKNRIYNGDCFEMFKEIEDNSIDLIVTDPPYYFRGHQNRGLGTEGTSQYANSELFKEKNKLSTMGSFDGKDVYRLLDECDRVLKMFRGYFFCNEYLVPFYTMWALEHKYMFCIITIAKNLKVINRNRYSTDSEFMIRIYKSGAGLNVLDYTSATNNINWLSSIQKYIAPDNKLHPTQKPYDIIEGVVKLNTQEGETVLDPFLGSGTTAEVCRNLKRNYIGIEIDKKYFDIAEKRLSYSQLSIF